MSIVWEKTNDWVPGETTTYMRGGGSWACQFSLKVEALHTSRSPALFYYHPRVYELWPSEATWHNLTHMRSQCTPHPHPPSPCGHTQGPQPHPYTKSCYLATHTLAHYLLSCCTTLYFSVVSLWPQSICILNPHPSSICIPSSQPQSTLSCPTLDFFILAFAF